MNTQTTHDCADVRESIGQQLRSARIAKGYSVADVATRMRVLANVVEDVENDDFSRLGAPIFVRGYLSSYCRLLDIAMPPAEALVGPVMTLPELRPMARSSRVQRAVEHSARSLVYVVLSASIGIPVVWFALNTPNQSAPVSNAALTRLDPLPEAAQAATPSAPNAVSASDAAAASAADGNGSPPVVASLAGFYPQTDVTAPAAATGVDDAAEDAATPATAMVLHFRERSWLEVRSNDGARLDEALVEPGEDRSYPLDRIGNVTLGNAAGVDVNVGDTPVDTSAYRRADVARFKVSSDGRLTPSDG